MWNCFLLQFQRCFPEDIFPNFCFVFTTFYDILTDRLDDENILEELKFKFFILAHLIYKEMKI